MVADDVAGVEPHTHWNLRKFAAEDPDSTSYTGSHPRDPCCLFVDGAFVGSDDPFGFAFEQFDQQVVEGQAEYIQKRFPR